MSTDIYYENQKNHCKNTKTPLFAYDSCNHIVKWGNNGDIYRNEPTKLGDMLVDKYGEAEAFKISSGSLITSCPVCSKSWID